MKLDRGEQKKLAEMLGISPKHFNDILKGRRRPSPELAVELERYTGIGRCAWLWPDEYDNSMRKGGSNH
jgi:plasmid maintenance system antidote protein VapI